MSRQMFAKGGAAFPDLSGDGKVTQKDVLIGRGVIEMQDGWHGSHASTRGTRTTDDASRYASNRP